MRTVYRERQVLQRLVEGCDEFLHHNGIDYRVMVKTNGTEAERDRKCEEPLEYFVHPEDVELQRDEMGRGLEHWQGWYTYINMEPMYLSFFDRQSLEARKVADHSNKSRHVAECDLLEAKIDHARKVTQERRRPSNG
jgi:hypothetical protein